MINDLSIETFLREALREDIGRGDLFAPLADNREVKAVILSKDNGILAGAVYLQALCELQDIQLELLKNDGDTIAPSETIATFSGDIATILSTERVALNTLQHASGIATNTYAYAKLLQDSNIKLLDTRKTRPLLRNLEKYAVRVGGGTNHRMGLDDCLMLKDTHLATIDNFKDFIQKARKSIPFTAKIEMECDSIELAESALEARVDILMCDNMSPKNVKSVVTLRNNLSKNTLIEISGNITKENITDYLNLGIDAISSGSLIHQARWLDMSMKIR